MLRPLFDIEPLSDHIERGDLIITANNRLAAKIRQAWGVKQAASSCNVWHQPAVYAIDSWVQELWQSYCDAGSGDTERANADQHSPTQIVTPAQETLVWQNVIANDDQRAAHIQPAGYATLARQTYRQMQQWRIPVQHLAAESPDFYRWATAFDQVLKRCQMQTQPGSCEALVSAFSGQRLSISAFSRSGRITLVGFQTMPPIYLQLVESAADPADVEFIAIASAETDPHPAKKQAFTDSKQELLAAIKWATRLYETDPGQRIGIVIPDLQQRRSSVERLLNAHTGDNTATAFNISAGVPLANTAMVREALSLLDFNRPKISLNQCSALLNSPFWGGDPVAPTLKSAAEQRLQMLCRRELRSAEVRYQIAQIEQQLDSSETLSTALTQFETLRREAPATATFSSWATLFKAQLEVVGWPGQRNLTSEEYQQHQHWHDLVAAFSTLDQLQSPVSLFEALTQLKQLAGATTFQPETPDASIQILGLLESTALRFDHLWVMGTDDQQWPQPCQLNPLLSADFQRRHKMPRTLPERELVLAQQQLTAYQQHSGNTVFSFCTRDGDRQLACTPLLEHIPLIEQTTGYSDETSGTACLPEPQKLDMETIDCAHGPAVKAGLTPIKGGSSIFDTQALCPFNAFARYRLGAIQPPKPSLGLSAMDRGSLLHLCLEIIWKRLQSQQYLLTLTEQELREQIDQAISESISQWQKTYPELMGDRFVSLEAERLQNQLWQWMELEKQRTPFEIAEIEQRHTVTFGGLPVTLRIDRIDRLSNGKLLIIDYKTGAVAVNRWLGERPDQPQLPLYALTSEEPVAGISFAVINADQQTFAGISEQTNIAPGINTLKGDDSFAAWEQQQQQWRGSLESIAAEFISGEAEVCFYNNAAAQWQAELLPLNRWPEYTGELVSMGVTDE